MSYHGKRVNEVFQTKEYDKFKFIKDNRNINNNHVKRIVKSMKERGWLPGSYVIVNRLFEIIDGQHRTKAAIIAEIPISYVMETKATKETMHNLNKDQKNWTMIDHIHQFVALGNDHYVKLNKFIEEHPQFKPTEGIMFCKNQYTAVPRDSFENGLFTVKDMKKAYLWAEQITSLNIFPHYNRSIFVRAVITALNKPKFKMTEFIRKVKLRPTSLVPCGTVDQYLELIERIYNYHRSADERIQLRY